MPIYEYKCGKCGHVFDAMQRIGEDGTNLKCPMCNAPRPDKIFSAFSSSGAAGVSSGGGGNCSSSGFG
ncbi:zinc ribbon domain-containing protein [candidate division KSB1 bacterium]|nr:zinc ribbon domain-containing protein [candidate division KSB1 bacterium]